ncbi:MAG: sulfur carrier protein ThiS [Planctomycetes bacterium]|nr:sulfur carrier protein ThiS [Planctomycetota bacterium]MCB9912115.1 sulfur carrier protein ThiS [Planctomycetota bacterium]HPF14735.1 sulfur carrier protein ThiS [Planctomycetota bacterium]
MEILVNGRAEQVEPGTNLAQWIAGKGLHPQQVAIEVNQALVPRDQREQVVLQPGDRVEMVSLVGGG